LVGLVEVVGKSWLGMVIAGGSFGVSLPVFASNLNCEMVSESMLGT
jgi:hypothetical protein